MAAPPLLPIPSGLDSCRAVAAYDPTTRAAIVRLKNGDRRILVSPLAEVLAGLAPADPALVVTWAPTGGRRRRRRGFDHAELLARAVARRRGLRVSALLRRLPGPAQVGRSAAERRQGPQFVARRACRSPVLLIDDVATTGATLSAAAQALRAAGAPEVHGLVVARAARSGTR